MPDPASFTDAFTDSGSEVLSAVRAGLVVVQGQHFGAGAGVVWRKDGMILTNNHMEEYL